MVLLLQYATKLVIADVQSFESKLKLTNKEFYAGSKHCSQKKDCSVMELKSKLNKLGNVAYINF